MGVLFIKLMEAAGDILQDLSGLLRSHDFEIEEG